MREPEQASSREIEGDLMFRLAKVAALAVAGVLGAITPAAASASSQALDWTKQTPATSPPARADASMAYDAATGTVVLFGGYDGQLAGDTWTWG